MTSLVTRITPLRVFAALTGVGRRHDEPFIGSSTLVLRVYSRGYNLNATFIELRRGWDEHSRSAKPWQSERNLRLRTKFMLAFALVTAGLTCATLLIVRRAAEKRVQQEIKGEACNALLTFQVLQHQRQVALSRKADLLASLASMRNGEATTIQDVGENPWQSEECDLFVLADSSGKITALHSTVAKFPLDVAQDMLSYDLKQGNSTGWWYSGTRLYQVVLQPFYDDQPTNFAGFHRVTWHFAMAAILWLAHFPRSRSRNLHVCYGPVPRQNRSTS